MEFLPIDEFEEMYIDTQNVYVQEESIDIPKINLSMIKEEENVITVIISHNHQPQSERKEKRINTSSNTIMNIKYVQC